MAIKRDFTCVSVKIFLQRQRIPYLTLRFNKQDLWHKKGLALQASPFYQDVAQANIS